MFKEQSKIIKKLAGYGSGVFLGRCADYVLKDEPGVCSVYLYAEESYRIKHLSEKEGRAVTAEEIRKEDTVIILEETGMIWKIMILRSI